MDFTVKKYDHLLITLKDQGFLFQPFAELNNEKVGKYLVLRQDVDWLPQNSLAFANIQSELGISSSFYFRSMSASFDKGIIKEIAGLGHEVGYHYEDLGAVAQRHSGASRRGGDWAKRRRGEDIEKEIVDIAIESFSSNLEKMRKIVPIKSICMHGSPMSRWDSRLLWKYYDYRDFGIVAEPYFDIDFSEMLYLTDTGRKWNGDAVSVRDKGIGSREQGVGSSEKGKDWKNDYYSNWKVKPVKGSLMNMTSEGIDFQNKYRYRSTTDIIKAVQEENFPGRAMITMHPQRWTDRLVPWAKELIWQNAKNVVKYFLIKRIGSRE